MKFLFIFYGYLETSGRAKEFIEAIGFNFEVSDYTLSNSKLINKLSKRGYSSYTHSKFIFVLFFFEVIINFIRNHKTYDGLIIFNGPASIIGNLLVIMGFKKKLIVQDFVEFYEIKNFRKNIISRLILRSELYLTKHADLIVAANSHRSKLMLEKYGLTSTPIVFENIWSLSSQKEFQSNSEHSNYNRPDVKKLKLIYTGSINSSSQFINLLNGALSNLDICQLRIAGRVNTKIIQEIKRNTILNNFCNIEFIGLLSHEELRLELKKSHVGLIFYPLDTLNNIYCAPGKLHEYIFEGLPIITSSNPPLREFTEKHGVGMSNDNFAEAIQWMYNNIDDCKRNVKKYISENNNIISENRMKLMDAINSAIESRKHSHD